MGNRGVPKKARSLSSQQSNSDHSQVRTQQDHSEQVALACESVALAKELADLCRDLLLQIREAESLLFAVYNLELARLGTQPCMGCPHAVLHDHIN
jgi:hypothetical protein